MYAYAGSKAIGVNSQSKYPEAAVQLAVYLGSAEAQRLHYELRNVIPCNTELLEAEDIASDELVIAQNDTFNYTSVSYTHLVIVDEEDFSQRLIRRIQRKRTHQGETKERFLYNYIAEFIRCV